jgi:uncharacterized protein YbcI
MIADGFAAASNGSPILARPFFQVNGAQNNALLTAFPGLVAGNIGIAASSKWRKQVDSCSVCSGLGIMDARTSEKRGLPFGWRVQASARAGLGRTIKYAFEVTMKSQGEIEAAICEGISRFEQDYMGRGPKDVHTHLLGDLLVVRLEGVLTAAEQQLVKALPAEKGRDLLKQVRTHLVETARPLLERMVQEVSGVKVLSLHHDISTVTGEEVVLFTLIESPTFRETKKK